MVAPRDAKKIISSSANRLFRLTRRKYAPFRQSLFESVEYMFRSWTMIMPNIKYSQSDQINLLLVEKRRLSFIAATYRLSFLAAFYSTLRHARIGRAFLILKLIYRRYSIIEPLMHIIIIKRYTTPGAAALQSRLPFECI